MSIVIPEVFSSAINEKLGVSLRVARLAYDATEKVSDILVAGNKVHFPTLKRVATTSTVTKGTALTPSTVDMNDVQADVKHIASAIRVFDSEVAQIKGSLKDEMIDQVATELAKTIDGDLVTALITDVSYKQATAGATALTANEIELAMANFGDSVDVDEFAGILIHSKLLPSFYAMPEFTSTALTYATDGNGIVSNGVVGYFRGISVIVCNNNTYDSVKNECLTFIVKKFSLGYVFQKNIRTEEDRQALLLATDLVSSSLYAVKLIDSKGAVLLRKTLV